jgi:hypothetical protein
MSEESPFIRHSAFGIRYSVFGIRYSALGVGRWALGDQDHDYEQE